MCGQWCFVGMVHYYILLFLLFHDVNIFLQFMGIAFINVIIKFCICPYISNRYPGIESVLLRPNSNEYGMPSGHCQIYFALVAYRFSVPMVIYGCLIAHERVSNGKHTVPQVLVGSVLGYMLGLLV